MNIPGFIAVTKNLFQKEKYLLRTTFYLEGPWSSEEKNITKLRKYVTNTEGTYVCYCFLGEWWHGCSECFIPTMLQVAQFSKNIYIHSSIHCFLFGVNALWERGIRQGPAKHFAMFGSFKIVLLLGKIPREGWGISWFPKQIEHCQMVLSCWVLRLEPYPADMLHTTKALLRPA